MRHWSLGQKELFLIFALTGGTEFNALKKIVRICLNVIINEKSLQYLL